MRDDFPMAVKETLARRVGMRRSNPECRKPTSGPKEDPSQAVNIGVATHITAASPGGARYDPRLSPEERRSAPNGIWLCQNCAHLIDTEEDRFPVDVIRLWKTHSEEAARLALETNTPSVQRTPHLSLPPPRIEIVSSESHFGRLDSKDGRFALLLKVRFWNESEQLVLIQCFQILHAGRWYAPQPHTGTVYLHVASMPFGSLLRPEGDITVSRRIQSMDVIERSAFFVLPDPQVPFPGPEALHLTAEVTFAHWSPRQITFTLTN
jgi:hypothetical protein